MDFNLILAHLLERAVRQPDRLPGERHIGRGGRFHNVVGADGAEQLAPGRGLSLQRQRQPVNFFRLGPGRAQGVRLRLLQLSPARLKLFHILRGGQRRLAAGDEIISAVAWFHGDLLPQGAQFVDLFKQYHFHLGTS